MSGHLYLVSLLLFPLIAELNLLVCILFEFLPVEFLLFLFFVLLLIYLNIIRSFDMALVPLLLQISLILSLLLNPWKCLNQLLVFFKLLKMAPVKV